MRITRVSGMSVLLVLGLALGGCGDDDGGGGGDTDSGPAGADSGGGDGCAMDFAGCAGMLVDMTGMAAVSISPSGFMWDPKCIRVSPGTMVTINGASLHPASQACGPTDAFGTSNTMPVTATLTAEGGYGFYCENHGSPTGTGMSGLILVSP
jgi:plastocyanin